MLAGKVKVCRNHSKETQELGWKSQSKKYRKNSMSPNSYAEYRLKMLGGRVEGGRMEGGRVKDGRLEGGRVKGGRVEGEGWKGGRVESEEGGGIKLFYSKETQELGWKSQSKQYRKNSMSPNSYPEYRLKMLGGRVEGGRMEGGRVKDGRVEGGG